MLYKTLSAAVYGIDANIIQVEVDCSGIETDQDHFHTVGLPDAAVRGPDGGTLPTADESSWESAPARPAAKEMT